MRLCQRAARCRSSTLFPWQYLVPTFSKAESLVQGTIATLPWRRKKAAEFLPCLLRFSHPHPGHPYLQVGILATYHDVALGYSFCHKQVSSFLGLFSYCSLLFMKRSAAASSTALSPTLSQAEGYMTMITAVISLRSSLGLLHLGVQKMRWLSSKGWKAARRKPRICYWDALGAERVLNPAGVLETHLHLPLALSPRKPGRTVSCR